MAIGGDLTKREQMLVGVALVAVLVLGGYWYLMYRGKAAELTALDARVVELERKNQQATRDLAEGSVERLQAEAARDARTLEIMERLVPTSNEVPALLEDVSTAARRVGLDIASVEPLPVIPGEDFDTYRYKLSVIGGYHAIGQFLSNVGSLSRIVAPVSIDIKRHTPANQTSAAARPQRPTTEVGRSRLETSFQVQTYVARVTPGAAGGAARGAAGAAP